MKTQTTNNTPKKIGTVNIRNNKAGILKATVSGFDGTDAITGQKSVKYKKNAAGNLIVGIPVETIPMVVDAALGSAAMNFNTVSDQVDIIVIGANGKTINWNVEVKNF